MKKNNKGFSRTEILTAIVLMLILFAFFGTKILNGTSNQKVKTMKENGATFSKSVVTNIASFRNSSLVYLGEAIGEKVMTNIRSPFGGKYCDPAFSKVEFTDGIAYTTLKCGNRLITHAQFKDLDKLPLYEVSEWTEKKPKEVEGLEIEEATLYNCLDGGKEKYDEYYESSYLVYKINQDYGSEYYFIDGVGECEVTSKTFYRTLKKIEVKEKKKK